MLQPDIHIPFFHIGTLSSNQEKKKESTETSWHFIIIFFIFKTFCCHPSPSSARYK